MSDTMEALPPSRPLCTLLAPLFIVANYRAFDDVITSGPLNYALRQLFCHTSDSN